MNIKHAVGEARKALNATGDARQAARVFSMVLAGVESYAELESLREARQARSGKHGIAVKGRSNLTTPKGYPSETGQYGDPVNLRYPLDKAHVLSAVQYFNHAGQMRKGGYTSKEWATIGQRIARAASKHLGGRYAFANGKVNKTSLSEEEYATGRGRMGGTAEGPGGQCVCPECGHKMSHETGTPCVTMKCEKCGVRLERSMAKSEERFGGIGSGNWGHDGRPGKRGGSAPGGGFGRIGVETKMVKLPGGRMVRVRVDGDTTVYVKGKAYRVQAGRTLAEPEGRPAVRGALARKKGLVEAKAQAKKPATKKPEEEAKAPKAKPEEQKGPTPRMDTPEEKAFAEAAMGSNEVSSKGQNGGINESHVIEYKDDGHGLWKPIEDHGAGCDSPGGFGHCGDSEVAAHQISEMLGGKAGVPPTVYSNHNVKRGTSQMFIEGAVNGYEVRHQDAFHNIKRGTSNRESLEHMVALDVIMNNTDRHQNNWMVANGQLFAIDHGHCKWGRSNGRVRARNYALNMMATQNEINNSLFTFNPTQISQWKQITRDQFNSAFDGIQTGPNRRINTDIAWENFQNILEHGTVRIA